MAMGEADKAICAVQNRTNWEMKLIGSNLSWGKWVTTPVDVSAGSTMHFEAEGREASPSGTEGWASWQLIGNPSAAKITVNFNVPYIGSDTASISCDPSGVVATSYDQSHGDADSINYYVG